MAKGQFDHSYTFGTMPIMIFSPVYSFFGHTLCYGNKGCRVFKDIQRGRDTKLDRFFDIEKIDFESQILALFDRSPVGIFAKQDIFF